MSVKPSEVSNDKSDRKAIVPGASDLSELTGGFSQRKMSEDSSTHGEDSELEDHTKGSAVLRELLDHKSPHVSSSGTCVKRQSHTKFSENSSGDSKASCM